MFLLCTWGDPWLGAHLVLTSACSSPFARRRTKREEANLFSLHRGLCFLDASVYQNELNSWPSFPSSHLFFFCPASFGKVVLYIYEIQMYLVFFVQCWGTSCPIISDEFGLLGNGNKHLADLPFSLTFDCLMRFSPYPDMS